MQNVRLCDDVLIVERILPSISGLSLLLVFRTALIQLSQVLYRLQEFGRYLLHLGRLELHSGRFAPPDWPFNYAVCKYWLLPFIIWRKVQPQPRDHSYDGLHHHTGILCILLSMTYEHTHDHISDKSFR